MIYSRIAMLVEYAISKELIDEVDRIWAINRLCDALKIDEYKEEAYDEVLPLEQILSDIDNYAYENGIIESNTKVVTDVFDSGIMGILTPMPHEVIDKFFNYYHDYIMKATNWYYKFSQDTDYIRTYRIKKDKKWKYKGKYGTLDITINLSKPEKDPKDIAKTKSLPQSGYPKCALCKESEGYKGTLRFAGRSNHRIIPIVLCDEDWYFQYSPYVYYNEHCICLSAEHRPMKINRELITKMFEFVTIFPHYFIGSNADLPIVGGSILSHDHMQGGRYTFAMELAPNIKSIKFDGYKDIKASIVKWPLSVIRIRGKDTNRLADLAEKILNCWRGYTDENAFVFAETDGVPHNTITPIARTKGEDEYELDLVLRNNITTDECPLGFYHPHADKHNIKKENIGLIEVMGLAVLPSRLLKEMQIVKECILKKEDISKNKEVAHHANWANAFISNYEFTQDNIDEIIEKEIGNTFERVLEDAGVYKCNEEGLTNFIKFINYVNGETNK